MPKSRNSEAEPLPQQDGMLPTLIDNREDNTMLAALRSLCGLCSRLDIATGYFEVGAFADLHGHWQNLTGIRLLMGDELTRKTRDAIVQALRDQATNGVERIQEVDDWNALDALEAFRLGLETGRIKARAYTKAKFHAKALRFHRANDVVSHAILGSSNFTHPGLTQNIELNIITSDNAQITELDRWYERVWAEAEDLQEDLLRIIEPHVKEYQPFEIYLKAMRERFYGLAPDETSWEATESKVFPFLAGYQKDAYFDLRHMAERWGGGLLCDGVGLGKTFVALALIEKALAERKRVLVIAPKAAIPSVWNRNLARFFEHDFDPEPQYQHDIRVIPQTDFGRDGTISWDRIARLREKYDVIIVDEAHHFRVPHRNRSKKLMELARDKTVFLLTATPVNNSLDDLYHLLNYIAQNRKRHFQAVNVPDLRAWFVLQAATAQLTQLSLDLGQSATMQEFLKHVVVQRSRRYVNSLDKQENPGVKFPEREFPEVVHYSLSEVYGTLLPELFEAFHPSRPKLKLAIYQTESYKEEDKDTATVQEQGNVVSLVRTMLLKRLESSEKALEASVEDLLSKHVALLQELQPLKHLAWVTAFGDVNKKLERHRRARLGMDDEDEEEDNLPLTGYEHKKLEEIRAAVGLFGRNEEPFFDAILDDATVLAGILGHLYDVIGPENDAKLLALIAKIKATPRLQQEKFVLFSEFKDTARYLEEELKKAFPDDDIVEVDSGRHVKDRDKIIRRFAPYYNGVDDAEVEEAQKEPIRVLVSTDVLSEGLNLQDANVIVNYDLHWNPVRLMQRIGRVDRRMDPSKPVDYDKVYVYNFLPPADLDRLLGLYNTLTGKLAQINRSLGIEAPVLDPDDDFEARNFYLNAGQGTMSVTETLRLEAHRLAQAYPELWAHCERMPNRVYSGKDSEPKRLFLCFRVPVGVQGEGADKQTLWDIKWYLHDPATGTTTEALDKIHEAVTCGEGTPRNVTMAKGERTGMRQIVEKTEVGALIHRLQLPASLRANLVCWMEVR